MPRCARLKSNEAIYHVMVRSISEVQLLETEADKYEYIKILKEYQKLYRFKVYGYCLMDNHAHFMIDANGADISKIMHSINFKYAQYFNRKHKRHGHLFQDRFKSKIVKDVRYLFALSAYIHNNAADMSGYGNCPEEYIFSSLGVYIGLRKDTFGILDDRFVMSFCGNKTAKGRRDYYQFVMKCNDIRKTKEVEFEDEGTEYRSERKLLVRDVSPEKIIEYIMEAMDITKTRLLTKNTRGSIEAKAMMVFLMRCLCNVRCSDICRIFGNMTQSRISRLCRIGVELYDKDKNYEQIIDKFINLR